MEKALYYMFKDNLIKQKMLSYFLLVFVTNACFMFGAYYLTLIKANPSLITYSMGFILAGLILAFPAAGYYMSCIKSIMTQDENIVLPTIHLGKNFVFGFKYFLTVLLFALCFVLVYCFFAVLLIFLFKYTNLSLIVSLMSIFLILLMLVFLFFIWVISLALLAIFAKTEFYTSLFRYPLAIKLIKNNPGNYFISFLLYVAVAIFMGIINSFLNIFIINKVLLLFGVILISAVASYFIFVTAYIVAKSVDSKLIEIKTDEL